MSKFLLTFRSRWEISTCHNVPNFCAVPQTVDRFGRRPLLMISASGQALCFAVAAILLSTGSQSAAFGATAMVFIFQIFLGIGYLPIVRLCSNTICREERPLTGYDPCAGFWIGVGTAVAGACLALAVSRGGESEWE